jgi:hypothetical protein
MNPSLHDERGGVVAKLLGLLVVLAVLAGGALYWYGTEQEPLVFDGVHVATGDHQHDPKTVAFTAGATITVATIVRNVGRLPVTLEGLPADPPGRQDPFVPVSIGLGDGRTATDETAAFTPPTLDPSSGIGVVITFGVNPNLACTRFTGTPSEPLNLPPVTLSFSSYGVESTQAVPLDAGAPRVTGLTRTRCEAAIS